MLKLSEQFRAQFKGSRFSIDASEVAFQSTYYDGDYVPDPGVRLPGYTETELETSGGITIKYGNEAVFSADIVDENYIDNYTDEYGRIEYNYSSEETAARDIFKIINKAFDNIVDFGYIEPTTLKEIKNNYLDEDLEESKDWDGFLEYVYFERCAEHSRKAYDWETKTSKLPEFDAFKQCVTPNK